LPKNVFSAFRFYILTLDYVSASHLSYIVRVLSVYLKKFVKLTISLVQICWMMGSSLSAIRISSSSPYRTWNPGSKRTDAGLGYLEVRLDCTCKSPLGRSACADNNKLKVTDTVQMTPAPRLIHSGWHSFRVSIWYLVHGVNQVRFSAWAWAPWKDSNQRSPFNRADKRPLLTGFQLFLI
jgi:hypothetical protein